MYIVGIYSTYSDIPVIYIYIIYIKHLFNKYFLILAQKTDPQDPRITPKDFEEAVEKEPLVLEILGPCLPAPKVWY